ncbi:hypothetical protein Fmac_028186 [Flemingia macrophylla]|uniref:Uncharacterized protein n=1 Tax=Flemingia macrophylla TaxID=520843 RepID=A0ABD1L6S6_9FABA
MEVSPASFLYSFSLFCFMLSITFITFDRNRWSPAAAPNLIEAASFNSICEKWRQNHTEMELISEKWMASESSTNGTSLIIEHLTERILILKHTLPPDVYFLTQQTEPDLVNNTEIYYKNNKTCSSSTILLLVSDYKSFNRFSFVLLTWILSRVLGASVGFCVGGCNSLRDVAVKFKKDVEPTTLPHSRTRALRKRGVGKLP